MKTKTLISIIVGTVFCGAVASYASPYITLHSMRSAMMEKDADSFASNVDFPALRESLRAQFVTMMQSRMSNDTALKNDPFAGFGMMLGVGVANQFIDAMVTPAGVMQLMINAGSQPSAKRTDPAASSDAAKTKLTDYSVHYRSWSTVSVTGRQDEDESVALTFKRSGLWSWKLTSVVLPPSVMKAD
jgi:hypothetical protein